MNHYKCAVSSCVTSTPLNLLATALDVRSYRVVVPCVVSLILYCSVVIVVHRLLLSSVSFLCATAGTFRRQCELAINYTFGTRLINRQGLYITYDPFHFNQRFACESRIGSMFDPTTCYSLFQTDTTMSTRSKPCTAMLLLLIAQPLLSMHA